MRLPYKPSRKFVKHFLIFAIPLAAIIFYLIYDPMPEIAPPQAEKMPNPNALDTYTKAAAAITKKQLFPAFNPISYKRPLAEQNRDLDKAVKANKSTYALIHLGLTQKYAFPVNPNMLEAESVFSRPLLRIRDIGKILASKAGWHANHRDFDNALNTTVDGLLLGSQTMSSGILINRLVGIALNGIARRKGWDYAGQASANASKDNAFRIIDIEEKTRNFDQIMRFSLQCDYFTLALMLKEPNWKSSVCMFAWRNEKTADALQITMRTISDSRRNALEQFEIWKNGVCNNLNRKFSKRMRIPMPSSPIASTSAFDYYVHVWCSDLNGRTLNLLLAIELALRAYKLETGTYPESLEQLVQKYLPALPTDPFDPGVPFRYKRTASHYLLYSVGPDGVDDGGKSIPKKYATAFATMIDENSLGDIVEGITK